jgi:hypothetical protein
LSHPEIYGFSRTTIQPSGPGHLPFSGSRGLSRRSAAQADYATPVPIRNSAPVHPAGLIPANRNAAGSFARPSRLGRSAAGNSDNFIPASQTAIFHPANHIPPGQTATFSPESGILPDRSETIGHTAFTLTA